MARAHRANTMAGHLGAALVAGRLFGEAHRDLDRRVHKGIEGELERIMRGEESIWFDPAEAGITVSALFGAFPREDPKAELTSTITDALSRNIDGTRQSGHNVIFAAIAVRALHEHPEFATPSIIGGIRELIEGFDGAHAGRGYYGAGQGWHRADEVSLPADKDLPPYEDELGMAEGVMDALVRGASEHRQGYGGLWHLINHAAALADLSRLGYRDLAREGLAAQRHHLRLWRSLPDLADELGPVSPAQHDPRTPAFWAMGTLKRDSARLTHRIKTLYGFHSLARLIESDAARERAGASFLYLMA